MRPAPIAWLYLAFSVVGLVSTWTYNLLSVQQLGRLPTPAEFITAGFTGSAVLGSLSSDFWVGSLATLIWAMVEARRLKMRWPWLYFVMTFLIAWAFALPLFLFMRERHLAARKAA